MDSWRPLARNRCAVNRTLVCDWCQVTGAKCGRAKLRFALTRDVPEARELQLKLLEVCGALVEKAGLQKLSKAGMTVLSDLLIAGSLRGLDQSQAGEYQSAGRETSIPHTRIRRRGQEDGMASIRQHGMMPSSEQMQ